MTSLPSTVNLHLTNACNYKCRFCFAGFPEAKMAIPMGEWKEIIRELARHGVRRLNFAGGEPTLVGALPDLVRAVKQAGMQASIVSNGTRPAVLERCMEFGLDLVGLSIESGSDATNVRLGRGYGQHVQQTIANADRVHQRGVALKINTVVTAANVAEDLSALILRLAPLRWKIFQMLPIRGENDRAVADLTVDQDAFEAFVDRHRHLGRRGIELVPESNTAMTGSYVMINPEGCFYDNVRGQHTTSRPIREVGLLRAFSQVTFHDDRFESRGGSHRIRIRSHRPPSRTHETDSRPRVSEQGQGRATRVPVAYPSPCCHRLGRRSTGPVVVSCEAGGRVL
jgi:radical S-adenosyl methionine domain-containing protein 2